MSFIRKLPLLLSLILTLPGLVQAEALTARQIMEKVDAMDVGDHAVQDVVMILIDENDKQLQQQLRSYRKKFGEKNEDTKSIMFYLSPESSKDVAFLTYDYDDEAKEDEQWLYLPGLKKTKRIAANDKSSSFMGTDFSYADMSSRNMNHYDYKLIKEDVIDGHKVWVIESTPLTEDEIKETGYIKSLVFVRQDNFVIVRSINKMKKGNQNKFMEVKVLEQIQGIWVQKEVTMTTKKGEQVLHKTIMKVEGVKFDQKLSDDLFTLRKLESGL